MSESKSIAVLGFLNSLRHWLWLLILPVGLLANAAPTVSQAQINAYTPLRTFGSNVYDFTPVIRNVLSGSYSKYFIHGIVQGITASGAQIVDTVVELPGITDSDREGSVPPPGLSVMETVRTMAARSASANQERLRHYQLISFVTNPPAGWRPGTTVSVFAWPRGAKGQNNYVGADRIYNGLFDFGTPFTGRLAGLTVNQITENGFVPIRHMSDSEIEARKAKQLQNVIAFQRENAAHGDPTAQYALAMHYLNGDGVETNRAIGIHWLQSATTNGSLEAKIMLERLTNRPSLGTNAPFTK